MTAAEYEAAPDPFATLAAGLMALVDLLELPEPQRRPRGTVALLHPAWRLRCAQGFGARRGALRFFWERAPHGRWALEAFMRPVAPRGESEVC